MATSDGRRLVVQARREADHFEDFRLDKIANFLRELADALEEALQAKREEAP